MADIAGLVNQLMTDGTVPTLALNPQAQFGIAPRRYLGAELLPERAVDENAYREESIIYRTVIANDGTRYSPTQKKGAALIGSFLVELGNSDIATEFTSRDYDALLRMLDLDPATYRTEGGRLNLLKIRAALAERKTPNAVLNGSPEAQP